MTKNGKRTIHAAVSLTKRDHDILEAIAANQFVTTEQIRDRFWHAKQTHNHYTRLRRLMRTGVIERLFGDNDARLGYRLTEKGINLLSSEPLKARAKTFRYMSYPTSFNHDKVMEQVRELLEQSPLISEYKSEREARELLAAVHGTQEKRGRYKVPDGLFALRTDLPWKKWTLS